MPDAARKTARSTPSGSDTLKGLGLMAFGFFCYSTSDMLAKLLTESMHPVQVAWVRQFGLLTGIVVLLALHGTRIALSSRPALQIFRGLTVVAASAGFVGAVAFVPLADAVAVSFLAPFLVTILGAIVLGERAGPHRWAAVVLGFVGTLIVVRPGFGAFHPAILLVVLTAFAFAARQIVSRVLAGVDGIATTIFYSGMTAAIVLTIPLPFFWTSPTGSKELALMAAMAVAAGSGELAIMRALDIAEASVLSPLQYTLMIWSTMWGFLVFAQLPDVWTLAGTGLIILSGMYTLIREGRRSRAPR